MNAGVRMNQSQTALVIKEVDVHKGSMESTLAGSCVDMKKDMRIPTSQQLKKLHRHLDTN